MGKENLVLLLHSRKKKIDGGFPNSLPSLPSDSPKDSKKILHLTRFTMLRKRA